MEENNVCDGKTGKQMDETGVKGSGKTVHNTFWMFSNFTYQICTFLETPDYFIVTYSNTISIFLGGAFCNIYGIITTTEVVVNTSKRSAPTKRNSYSKVALRKQSHII